MGIQELKQIHQEFISQAEKAFQIRFLTETGIMIGDTVKCSFNHNYGDSKRSYSTSTISDGIISMNKDGNIFVESVGMFLFSFTKDNNRSGTSYRSWWAYDERKAKSNLLAIIL